MIRALVVRVTSDQRLPLNAGDADLQAVDDVLRNLLLNGEHVRHIANIAFGPQVTAVFGADELRGDPHAIAGFANGAFEHRLHLELSTDAPDIGVGLLHAER